jgi:hypothetical protein
MQQFHIKNSKNFWEDRIPLSHPTILGAFGASIFDRAFGARRPL